MTLSTRDAAGSSLRNQLLPLTGKVAIYARVASPILCTRHPAQTEQLLALAKQLGFAERQIINFDQDHGRQGNSGIAKRGSNSYEGSFAILFPS